MNAPEPVLARDMAPDWLKSMPTQVKIPGTDGEIPTAKKCPPFIDSLQVGFYLRLSDDVFVGDDGFSFSTDPYNLVDYDFLGKPISFHDVSQLSCAPLPISCETILKFHNHYTIGIDPGWSIFVTHPSNAFNTPFRTISAVVDVDLYSSTLVHVPALWVDPNFRGLLRRGMPFAQCIPFQRTTVELDVGIMDEIEASDFFKVSDEVMSESGVYRRKFRAKRN
jgi:hypothetical protein